MLFRFTEYKYSPEALGSTDDKFEWKIPDTGCMPKE